MMRLSLIFSCLIVSVTQSSPKLSQAKQSTGRGPSKDQSAISTAPVSEAGTMPTRKFEEMPRSDLVRSMASLSLALPGLERCERPSSAPLRASGVQPGRLAQGPDEKKGRAGRTAGIIPVMFIPFRMIAPRWGGVARDLCSDSLAVRQFRDCACDIV